MSKLKEYSANVHVQRTTGMNEKTLHAALLNEYAENCVHSNDSEEQSLMDVLGEKDRAMALPDGEFAELLMGAKGDDADVMCLVSAANCTFTLFNRRTRVSICFFYNDEEEFMQTFRRRFYRGGDITFMDVNSVSPAAGMRWFLQDGEAVQSRTIYDVCFVTSPTSDTHQAGVAQLVHSRHWRAFLSFVLVTLLGRDSSYKLRRGTGYNFGKEMPLQFTIADFLRITLHAENDYSADSPAEDQLTSLSFSSVEHDKSRYRRMDNGEMKAEHAEFAWTVETVRTALAKVHAAQMVLLAPPPAEPLTKRTRKARH